MKLIGVSGVFDYAGLSRDSRWRLPSCCLPRMLTASASGLYVFAAQCPTPPIPYLRFAAYLAIGLAQDSRPSGSLLLPCEALSSSTFMPVYPGALTSPLRSLTPEKANGRRKLVIEAEDRMIEAFKQRIGKMPFANRVRSAKTR